MPDRCLISTLIMWFLLNSISPIWYSEPFLVRKLTDFRLGFVVLMAWS